MTFDDQKEKDMAEIRENFKIMQENLERTQVITEQNAKAIEKNIKDTEKWRQEAKNFVTGSIENDRGGFVEAITRENLARLLKTHGINVLRIYANITDKAKKKWEVDAMAINGEEVVFVETKTTLSIHKVKRFIKDTLLKVRENFPEYKDKKIYGAVAFLESKKDSDPRKDEEVGQDAAEYALEQGLFVISVTGNVANMLNDKSFKPKIF